MLQQQATAGFMRHVLAHPASEAQHAKAEKRLAAAEQEAASLTARVGDPDAVADKRGHLPAERRSRHLHSLSDWRHGTLRELLRALFVPDYEPPRKPRRKPDPRRGLQRRLREAERQAADLRKQLAAIDDSSKT
jgi:hypothetical protein